MRNRLREIYEEIERLFDAPIPMKDNYYINLSVLKESEYKSNIDKLTKSSGKQKLTADGELVAYDALYGQETMIINPKEILKTEYVTDNDKNKQITKRALLIGTAGIGKSTFTKYLLFQWAHSDWYNEYTWMLRIPLRNLTIENYPETPQLIDVVVKECMEQIGLQVSDKEKIALENEFYNSFTEGKILLILDGYDEVAEHIHPQFTDLLKALFSFNHLIVTSRPSSLYDLREKFDFSPAIESIFEITGFSPSKMEDYINSYFNYSSDTRENEAKELIDYINKTPSISGACRIPINLELVCYTWHQHQIDEPIFSISKLYEKVMISLCIRYLEKPPLNKKIRDMGIDSILNECKIPLGFLEYFGYQSIQKKRLFLTTKEICQYISKYDSVSDVFLIKQQNEVGFIKSSIPDARYQGISPYYFNHLTFRDFFVARYIAACLQKQNGENLDLITKFAHDWQHPEKICLEEFISRNKFNDHYEMVWWFVAGILANSRSIISLEYFFVILLKDPKDLIGFQLVNILIRCLDEMQDGFSYINSTLKRIIFEYIENWLNLAIYNKHKELISNRFIDNLRLSRWLLKQYEIKTIFKSALNTPDIQTFLNCLEFILLIEKKLKKDIEDIFFKSLIGFLNSLTFADEQLEKLVGLCSKLLSLSSSLNKKVEKYTSNNSLYIRISLNILFNKYVDGKLIDTYFSNIQDSLSSSGGYKDLILISKILLIKNKLTSAHLNKLLTITFSKQEKIKTNEMIHWLFSIEKMNTVSINLFLIDKLLDKNDQSIVDNINYMSTKNLLDFLLTANYVPIYLVYIKLLNKIFNREFVKTKIIQNFLSNQFVSFMEKFVQIEKENPNNMQEIFLILISNILGHTVGNACKGSSFEKQWLEEKGEKLINYIFKLAITSKDLNDIAIVAYANIIIKALCYIISNSKSGKSELNISDSSTAQLTIYKKQYESIVNQYILPLVNKLKQFTNDVDPYIQGVSQILLIYINSLSKDVCNQLMMNTFRDIKISNILIKQKYRKLITKCCLAIPLSSLASIVNFQKIGDLINDIEFDDNIDIENITIINSMMRSISSHDILTSYNHSNSEVVRINLLCILINRFLLQGKAAYLTNNDLCFYEEGGLLYFPLTAQEKNSFLKELDISFFSMTNSKKIQYDLKDEAIHIKSTRLEQNTKLQTEIKQALLVTTQKSPIFNPFNPSSTLANAKLLPMPRHQKNQIEKAYKLLHEEYEEEYFKENEQLQEWEELLLRYQQSKVILSDNQMAEISNIINQLKGEPLQLLN